MNTIMPLLPLFVLTYFHIFTAFAQNPTSISHTKLTEPPIKISNLTGPDAQFTRPLTLITGNTTISSPNKTFKLGFFSTNDESRVYLGIWYASIPTLTYVWVANRESPVGNLAAASLVYSGDGNLEIIDTSLKSPENVVWRSDNVLNGTNVKLLEQGNLVILSWKGEIVWNSFDYPADTWLPGMNLTAGKWLTSWKSSNDPAPGNYSLRLSQDYGEIVLTYNGDYVYWDTGKWSMNTFSGVPEMSIPYIYRFHFVSPWTPNASFGYTETALEGGKPPLTRFSLDYTGQLKQFTWSPQTANWNMFWSQPENENICKVYGLCGNFGFCNARMLNPCKCLIGFRPVDGVSWDAGGFSSGCRRDSDEDCNVKDGFKEVGVVGFDGAKWESFEASRDDCEKRCLNNCSCIGLFHNVKSKLCKNLFGSMLNIRNLTLSSTTDEVLHVRVPKEELIGGRRNVEGPPSFGKANGTGEKWFFPPWAAQHIIAGNVAAVIDERLGGVYNTVEAERLGMVAIWCIQDEEEQRPTMGMVVKMLEGVVEVTVPPPPKLLQALVSGESFHGVGVDSGNRASTTAGSQSDSDLVQLSEASRDAASSPKLSLG
ncbi:hypothetical protein ACET3Z_026402 [Daucus carota]